MLPITVGFRDSAVQMVSTLGRVVPMARVGGKRNPQVAVGRDAAGAFLFRSLPETLSHQATGLGHACLLSRLPARHSQQKIRSKSWEKVTSPKEL